MNCQIAATSDLFDVLSLMIQHLLWSFLVPVGVVLSRWRYTMYSSTHFHSTFHEILCVASGRAKLCFGGEENPDRVMSTIQAGDVMIAPHMDYSKTRMMLTGYSRWWEAIPMAVTGTSTMACLERMRGFGAFEACRGFKGTPSLVTLAQYRASNSTIRSRLFSGGKGGGIETEVALGSTQRTFSRSCPLHLPCGLAWKTVHEQHPCCRSKPPVKPPGEALVGWSRREIQSFSHTSRKNLQAQYFKTSPATGISFAGNHGSRCPSYPGTECMIRDLISNCNSCCTVGILHKIADHAT